MNPSELLNSLVAEARRAGASVLQLMSPVEPVALIAGFPQIILGEDLDAATVRAMHAECCAEAHRPDLTSASRAFYVLDSAVLGGAKCEFGTFDDEAILVLHLENPPELTLPIIEVNPPLAAET